MRRRVCREGVSRGCVKGVCGGGCVRRRVCGEGCMNGVCEGEVYRGYAGVV